MIYTLVVCPDWNSPMLAVSGVPPLRPPVEYAPLAILRREGGATSEEITTATGGQEHNSRAMRRVQSVKTKDMTHSDGGQGLHVSFKMIVYNWPVLSHPGRFQCPVACPPWSQPGG